MKNTVVITALFCLMANQTFSQTESNAKRYWYYCPAEVKNEIYSDAFYIRVTISPNKVCIKPGIINPLTYNDNNPDEEFICYSYSNSNSAGEMVYIQKPPVKGFINFVIFPEDYSTIRSGSTMMMKGFSSSAKYFEGNISQIKTDNSPTILQLTKEEQQRCSDDHDFLFEMAQKGYPEAEYMLATGIDLDFLDMENGVYKKYWESTDASDNFVAAAYWYKKAVEHGWVSAYASYADMLTTGRGNTIGGIEEAIKWCTKGAEAGDARAQYFLGRWYSSGEGGIPQDMEMAKKWLQKAAEQEYESAIELLKKNE